MIINDFLLAAGNPNTQEDKECLEYVEKSYANNLIDFNRYYWVSPVVRYKLISELAVSLKNAMFMGTEEAKKYIYFKNKLMEDKLEEDHKFLMQIKDMELEEYISRYHYQGIFRAMNYNVKLYNFSLESSEGFEEYESIKENHLEINKKSFSKIKLTSTLITILVIAVLVFLVAAGKSIVPILLASSALALAIFQDIKIGCLYKKGLKDEH